MGKEINLLHHYPKTKRDVKTRGQMKTKQDQKIARQFGKEFFDGDRRYGYGGFTYHPRFWQNVVPTFQKYYELSKESTLLDVGAAKGFMLFDFSRIIPGIQTAGIDISSYAITHAKEEIKPFLKVANAAHLPFWDNSFDLVISINTIHNLHKPDLEDALKEIERVSRKNSFIMVDAYRTEEEKKLMFDWNLTAKTILHVEEWKDLFKKVNYTGDYYWFTP